jgi:hypothetical protein
MMVVLPLVSAGESDLKEKDDLLSMRNCESEEKN